MLASTLLILLMAGSELCNRNNLDSLAESALDHYKDPCLKGEYCSRQVGQGEYDLRELDCCSIYPIMGRLFEKESSKVKRGYIMQFAGAYLRCDSLPSRLLRMGMKDTVLEVTVDASRSYAFRKYPNAVELLRSQIHSNNLNQRLAAVLGLQLLGKDAVPALLDAFSTPDDSIRSLLYSMKWFTRPTNGSPVYVMENDPSPKEMEALDLKYNSTLCRYAQSVINGITGEKMDGDTTRIQEWIRKQKFETAAPAKKKKARKIR